MAGETLALLTPRPGAPRRPVGSLAPWRRAARRSDGRRGSRAVGRPAPRAVNGAEVGRSARGRALRLNAVAGAFVLFAGLFHVWTGLEVGQLGYALSDARVLTERLDRELHELTVEYAADTAPRRLEQLASRRLGLRPPAPGQVVVLR